MQISERWPNMGAYSIMITIILITAYLPGVQCGEPSPSGLVATSNSMLYSLLGTFGDGLNLTSLLKTFRPPNCLQECLSDLHADSSLLQTKLWTTKQAKSFCSKIEAVKSCLANKPHCNSGFFDIALIAFNHLCNNDEAAVAGLVPCVKRNAMKIHSICEKECKLGARLVEAAALNTKTNALNLVDTAGNKFLSVPDLHDLCNSSTCFLSCMRSNVQEKCPFGGSDILDGIMESVIKRATGNVKAPEMRVLDTYAVLVSSVLPRQCRHLDMPTKDIVLTTQRTTWAPHFQIQNIGELGNMLSTKPATKKPELTQVPPTVGTMMSTTDDNRSIIEKDLLLDGIMTKLHCKMAFSSNGSAVTIPDFKTLVFSIVEQLVDGVKLCSSDGKVLELTQFKGIIDDDDDDITFPPERSKNEAISDRTFNKLYYWSILLYIMLAIRNFV